MKNFFLVVAIPIGIVILGISIVILDNVDDSYESHGDPNEWLKTTESIWNIEFENAEKDGYMVSDRGGFFGDGSSYIMARYKDEESAEGSFKWKKI